MDSDFGVIENLLGKLNIVSSDVFIPDGPDRILLPKIDRKIATWIDQQLDWREAVSVAFLLIPSMKVALRVIK